MPISWVIAVRKPEFFFEDIDLLAIRNTLFGPELGVRCWKILEGVDINIQFVVKAALELAALTG